LLAFVHPVVAQLNTTISVDPDREMLGSASHAVVDPESEIMRVVHEAPPLVLSPTMVDQ
jgi:hypothetical protein